MTLVLFNSYAFIGAFLPTALIGYAVLGRFGTEHVAQAWLLTCSFLFWGYWYPLHLPILVGSCITNYMIGRSFSQVNDSVTNRRALLWLGVVSNLVLLIYFKYCVFLVQNVGVLTGVDFAVQSIVLPLGISFFTFQQIAYLVDAHNGDAGEYSFVDYCLFVTFFPQLIAGTIVHHREMMGQFTKPVRDRLNERNFAIGVTYFALGLFKKVVIADNISTISDKFFAEAAVGTELSGVEAWRSVLAYTLQLYFDFSGYSDMAIGLALMFGIRLPFNFNSPYKATSISDFWRRWHMTLSRFLRDYLYVPLGGNRYGKARRYANLMITMVLGGLWHGAGWTFLIWGALHGTYLMINHAWQSLRMHLGLTGSMGLAGIWIGRVLTLLCVMVAWVFFRSSCLEAASHMLSAMVGLNGWIGPDDQLARFFEPLPEGGPLRIAHHVLGGLTPRSC
ncbi:MBOAT family O-acyltransferase [Methylobacterium iners]|uniref:Probable alginate O-acetylase AlgI n=1 Tax=Methylobacterium iners TaxID=418707 RepID=A0ABQ4S5Z8_9HYPH|nr:MBOAT family protein [Methylobacterium iners]GJD97918.1 Peptidoglycan O-acetyltransferase [Methylobacterium iners]